MSEESTNAQVQQPPVPPVSPGSTVEELQARIAELERQSEGRLRDLQHERTKRQEVEQRYVVSAPSPEPIQPDVTHDELGKVLNPYIAPLQKQVAAANQELEQLRMEKAQNYLVQKTNKSWDAIEADQDFQSKLLNVVRKYGITGNVYERTTRAYDLMQLEDLRARQQEQQRAASVAASASMPTALPPQPASSMKQYSAEEFNRMPSSEFAAMSSKGDFRKNPDGTFSFISR
jgi:hypothetical protein